MFFKKSYLKNLCCVNVNTHCSRLEVQAKCHAIGWSYILRCAMSLNFTWDMSQKIASSVSHNIKYFIRSFARSGLYTIWYVMRSIGFDFSDISHVKAGVIAHQKIEVQPIVGNSACTTSLE